MDTDGWEKKELSANYAKEREWFFLGKTIAVTTSVVPCHCERSAAVPTTAGQCHCERNKGRCAQEKKPVHRFRRLPQIFFGENTHRRFDFNRYLSLRAQRSSPHHGWGIAPKYRGAEAEDAG